MLGQVTQKFYRQLLLFAVGVEQHEHDSAMHSRLRSRHAGIGQQLFTIAQGIGLTYITENDLLRFRRHIIFGGIGEINGMVGSVDGMCGISGGFRAISAR